MRPVVARRLPLGRSLGALSPVSSVGCARSRGLARHFMRIGITICLPGLPQRPSIGLKTNRVRITGPLQVRTAGSTRLIHYDQSTADKTRPTLPRWPANRVRAAAILWPGKTDRTFSDAITAVRRQPWTDWVFATPRHHEAFARLSRPIRAVLLNALAPAA